ncbi:MAG: hypothetical protein GEV12_09075 [Micromonosporaceae bacterium]|nr:hypothetical protein [Micromonosporaceae bacterium]
MHDRKLAPRGVILPKELRRRGRKTVEFGVLGPLQVRHAGENLLLGTPQQQLVLVLLVVNLGRAASLEGVIYELWGETPPPSAVAKVRGYAAALRRLFESVQPGVDRIIRAGSGYLLNVDDSEVDLGQFSQDVSHGRRALAVGDLPAARDSFEQALGRWRGTMLDGLPRGPLIASRCSTVEQDRLAVIDSLAELQLRQGQPAQASALIWPQVHAEPLREQSYALLMRARYQVDGVAGALDVYETLRRSLAEQLGIEPGAELQRLHRAVLNRDRALEPPDSAPPPPAYPEQPPPPAYPQPAYPEPAAATANRAGGGSLREPPVLCTLPPDLPDFVGRRPEARLLRDLLARQPRAGVAVVAIAGRGGVGKTTLGVHVAHGLQADYPDGQIYVDLRGYDRRRAATAYEVLGRLLRLLGVDRSAVSESAAERTERYRDALARRRVLLVLDNVASDRQIRPLIPGGRGCAVIAISRARLGASFGAHLLDLDVLDGPTASGLLAHLAGTSRTEAEPGAVAELAQLCGYLPLALRIAGGRLAAKPHWSVGKLVELLRDERARLDQLSHHHLDLRSSITLSYRSLPQDAQRLFRRLGALEPSEISLRLAAAVLDSSTADAEQVLEQLVDARLVQVSGRDPGGELRCRLDDLLRLFAGECAEREETPHQLAAARARALRTRAPRPPRPPRPRRPSR